MRTGCDSISEHLQYRPYQGILHEPFLGLTDVVAFEFFIVLDYLSESVCWDATVIKFVKKSSDHIPQIRDGGIDNHGIHLYSL